MQRFSDVTCKTNVMLLFRHVLEQDYWGGAMMLMLLASSEEVFDACISCMACQAAQVARYLQYVVLYTLVQPHKRVCAL